MDNLEYVSRRLADISREIATLTAMLQQANGPASAPYESTYPGKSPLASSLAGDMPPVVRNPCSGELARRRLTMGAKIGASRTNMETPARLAPILGAVCTTVEDVCVKVDQDKDAILDQITSSQDIITIEATAHYDSLASQITAAYNGIIDAITAARDNINAHSDTNKTAIINALVGYFDATTGTVAVPVLNIRSRIGTDLVDGHTVFQLENLINTNAATAASASALARDRAQAILDTLGAFSAPSDTVKVQLNHIETENSNTASDLAGISDQVQSVYDQGTTNGVNIGETKGAVMVEVAKYAGGTLIQTLADWLLGQGNAPPLPTITPLTPIDIIDEQFEMIPPGMFGISVFLDAPLTAAHRFSKPDFYFPPIGWISFYGTIGFLRGPVPINIEFQTFYPFPQGATQFAIQLAPGVTGTYTALVQE